MSVLPKSVFVHFRRGEFAQADQACAEVLAQHPTNADAWHMRGILALNRKDYGAAAEFIGRAVAERNEDAEMHANLGIAFFGTEKVEQAMRALERALELDNSCAEAHLYLAWCHLWYAAYPASQECIEHALKAKPAWPEALELKALIATRLGRFDEAVALAKEALRGEPTRSDAHRILGDIWTRRRNYPKAISHYRAALERNPSNRDALCNAGLLLARIGRHGKAVVNYRKALSLSPGNSSAKNGLALSLLALGELNEGWPLYVARHEAPGQTLSQRPIASERLNRPPLRGERVLAWTDQGIGEQIMFASMVPDLVETGAVLSLECDDRLARVFQRSFPGVEILPRTNPPHPRLSERMDGQFSLPDAGAWFRNDFSAFPRHRGYLSADQAMVAKFRARYAGRMNRPVIGISWRTAEKAKVSADKTLPLAQWTPLLHMPGVIFVSLQYGDCFQEVAEVHAQTGVRILCDPEVDPMTDLDVFAAQVSAMDLVITTSNTTAHMAGALNVPVWTLVPHGFGGLWHWFENRDDSPWYPSMRLFRQKSMGDWEPVLECTTTALLEFLDERQNR